MSSSGIAAILCGYVAGLFVAAMIVYGIWEGEDQNVKNWSRRYRADWLKSFGQWMLAAMAIAAAGFIILIVKGV